MICCICKQDFPESEFYPSELRAYRKARCKECHKRKRKESYDKKHPQVYVGESGKLLKRSKGHPYIYWSGSMISELKRFFPTTKNKELAELIGVSERTLVRKARELGITKTPEWQANMSRRNGFLGYYEWKRKQLNS